MATFRQLLARLAVAVLSTHDDRRGQSLRRLTDTRRRFERGPLFHSRVTNGESMPIKNPFKSVWYLFVVTALVMTFLPHTSFAQTAASNPTSVIPSWVPTILGILGQLPYVGPYVSLALLWVGKIAAFAGGVFTALSVFVGAVALALQGITSVLGLQKAAAWIANANAVVQPWLQYFSVFNVSPSDPNHPAVALGLKQAPPKPLEVPTPKAG